MDLPSFITDLTFLLLMTCFVKVVTTMSILRYGLGLHGLGFGAAVLAASLGLSWFIMQPYLGDRGLEVILSSSSNERLPQIESTLRPFLEKHADPKTVLRLERLQERVAKEAPQEEQMEESKPLSTLVLSFILSELQEAFSIGFIIAIPFLVIDLLVANVLMTLGMVQLSVLLVSLPLKILLFFAVDGWTLLSEKLFMTYV
ncbi:MAG: hypothetical protein KDD55_06625 [Bdellovibrionales bacterium]|nr:hypothetical protein [Bdellovibrionales bacterium]